MLQLPLNKVYPIGISALLTFILTTIAIFTRYWVIFPNGVPGKHGHVGLTPFYSFRPSWFQTSCLLMYISLAAFAPIFVVYLHACWKIAQNGLNRANRFSFTIIHYFCYVITCFQMVAFASTAIGCSQHSKEGWKLGWSAWFGLASFIVSVIPGGMATIVAKNDCK